MRVSYKILSRGTQVLKLHIPDMFSTKRWCRNLHKTSDLCRIIFVILVFFHLTNFSEDVKFSWLLSM